MLVSKNPKICVTPNAKPKICVTPNANPQCKSVEYRLGRLGSQHKRSFQWNMGLRVHVFSLTLHLSENMFLLVQLIGHGRTLSSLLHRLNQLPLNLFVSRNK